MVMDSFPSVGVETKAGYDYSVTITRERQGHYYQWVPIVQKGDQNPQKRVLKQGTDTKWDPVVW